MSKFKINRFWSVVATILVIYGIVKWIIPAVSRNITSLPFPLTVPGTLVFIYMTLTCVALFALVTFSDEFLEEFWGPIRKMLRGEYTKAFRLVVLVVVPLIVGWQIYDITVPKVQLPSSLRIQHPSSNFPKKFEAIKNPFNEPSKERVATFIEQVKEDEIKFIPQVQKDIDTWKEEADPDHTLQFLPGEPVKKLLAELKAEKITEATAKQALHQIDLFEGRALYAMNCRPCHGDSVAGDGPMADGFKLRPINFTDNGTIETIVEGYTFWRVMNGGPGLPTEATPWDSAMPEWKKNLTDEERWKIILAEYDLAEKTPRILESE